MTLFPKRCERLNIPCEDQEKTNVKTCKRITPSGKPFNGPPQLSRSALQMQIKAGAESVLINRFVELYEHSKLARERFLDIM